MGYLTQAQCEAVLDQLYTAASNFTGPKDVMDAIGNRVTYESLSQVTDAIDFWEGRRDKAITAASTTGRTAIAISRRRSR